MLYQLKVASNNINIEDAVQNKENTSSHSNHDCLMFIALHSTGGVAVQYPRYATASTGRRASEEHSIHQGKGLFINSST